MAIDERSRHAMYLRLEEVLGAEQATTLMEHLPPVGWSDVATRRDIEVLTGEIGSLQAATTRDVDGLGREIGSLRAAITHGFDELRDQIRAAESAAKRDLDAMEKSTLGTLRSEIAQAFSAQTRTLVMTQLGSVVAAVALAFAAVKLA